MFAQRAQRSARSGSRRLPSPALQVRAPTRPHPEAANLPPFNEASLAAAKQGRAWEALEHCGRRLLRRR
jgi:hypothetical protein